jgi:large-conductance mechanosensitive channel
MALKVLVRSFIDAGVLGAVITLLTLLYRGTFIVFSGGNYFLSYGYPLYYLSISIEDMYGTFHYINFLNAFWDFLFYFAIVFVIVSLLSLAIQKSGPRRSEVIMSPEIEQKNKDRHPKEHSSLFTGTNEQKTLKVLRLLYLHNLAMTLLLVAGMTWTNWEEFPRVGWLIFNNVLEFASLIYWVVGVVLIFLYTKGLYNSKPYV